MGPVAHAQGPAIAGIRQREKPRAARTLRAFPPRVGPRASVVALCLALCAIVWALLPIQLSLERERIIDGKRQENGKLTRLFEEHVARTLRAAEVTLMEIVTEYRRTGAGFDLAAYAQNRGTELDPYNALSIVDEKGRRVLGNIPPLTERVDLSGTPDYEHHARHDTPRVFISTPRRGFLTGKWTLFVSQRVNRPDGSFGGYANVGIDPAYFSRIYDEIDLGTDSTVALVGRDGVIRARSAGADVTAGQVITDAELFRRLAIADHGSYVAPSIVDGITRIFSYRALRDYPLVVVIGTSQAAALAEHDARASRYVVAAAGITLVILCLGCFALRQVDRSQRAEEAVRRLNAGLESRVGERTAALESANRELEMFTSSVAHDLRAPLRGIEGYSQLLLRDHARALDDEGRRFLQNVCRAALHMRQLIEDLLAYARLEHGGQAAVIDPRALVESLLAERADDIGAQGATVSIDVFAAAVSAGREGLAMALRNLIDNALKFSRNAAQPAIVVTGREAGGRYVFSVRDNGIGFDMKYHGQIFGMFQRLHRNEDYPGTGIGLAIVTKAMERMGGRAWAESEPGTGATFYLELPG